MYRTKVLLSQFLVASVLIFTSSRAFADLIPDNTLGAESSRIRQNSSINDLNIEGGAQRGSNLFHSFSQFNINNGQSVYFSNPTGVQNILTRVTGGQISNILGTLGVNGSANLFLINPSGIIFGENARLDIGGSFIASSASNIKFLDGSQFHASLTQEKPLLTISVPVGLGMGSNPGEIKVLGPGSGIAYTEITKDFRTPVESNVVGLSLKTGRTLALVGGNVSIEGGVLQSPAGRIEIGSVGANTQVNLVPVTEGWKLGYETVSSFADINMSSQAFVNTTGIGGGYISLFGRNINLTKESIILADTKGNINGGDITIVGDSVTLNQSDASNNTFGAGNAGKIKLSARNSIKFENFATVGNHTASEGNGGEITLEADSVIIRNKSGAGSNTYRNATGRAGIVNIKGNYLLIEDNNAGFATRSFGRGDGGVINLEVGDIIVRNRSGMASDASGSGNGGQVNINANSLLIENNSGFSNRTFSGGGRGGDFNITVKSSFILRNRSGIRTSTFGSGDAGHLNLTANYLEISDTSGLRVESEGSGRAGTLNIVADTMQVNKSDISAKTTFGNGGNLTFNIGKLLQLNGKIQISSTAGTERSGGDGGNITINAPNAFIVGTPNGNSDITADAFNGRGGNVIIKTAGVFGMEVRSRENLERLLGGNNSTPLDPSSLKTNEITAISQQNPSLSGLVTINTPYVKPNSELVNLPSVPVDTRMSQGCYGANQSQSRFVNIGRSGLPPNPMDFIDGDVVDVGWVALKPSSGNSRQENVSIPSRSKVTANSSPEKIVEATGWIVNEKGIVMLVANLNSDGYSSWQNPNVNSCPK